MASLALGLSCPPPPHKERFAFGNPYLPPKESNTADLLQPTSVNYKNKVCGGGCVLCPYGCVRTPYSLLALPDGVVFVWWCVDGFCYHLRVSVSEQQSWGHVNNFALRFWHVTGTWGGMQRCAFIWLCLCHSLTDFCKYSYFASSRIYKGREGKGELRALLSIWLKKSLPEGSLVADDSLLLLTL